MNGNLSQQQFYHTGVDPSTRDDDAYIHVGTVEAGAARGRTGPRDLYRVHLQPTNPMNHPHAPLDDMTANRIDMYDGTKRHLGREPEPQDFDENFEDSPDWAKGAGWKPDHDAVFYHNEIEDAGSLSAMVRRSAISRVERL